MNSLRFFVIVRQKTACIIERLGRYHKTLKPGIRFMIPIVDNLAYRQSLKEETISIGDQMAITKDNVTVQIDGALFIQVFDAYKASYQVENPYEAVKLLAVTVLRSEIGKIKLDKLFQERQELNLAINKAVNLACQEWGINCLRYEILNIDPPQEIKASMQYEAEAERLKRREILISEGQQKSQINISEGNKIQMIKNAEGEAESIKRISQSQARAIEQIQEALKSHKNSPAIIKYLLLNKYLNVYKKTLKKSNLVVTPNKKGANGESGNQDLLSMAAMFMFQKSHPTGQFDPQLIDQYVKQIQKKRGGNQGSGNEQDALEDAEFNYSQLLSKMQYFDDPSLYNNSSSNLFQDNNSSDLTLFDDDIQNQKQSIDEYGNDQNNQYSDSYGGNNDKSYLNSSNSRYTSSSSLNSGKKKSKDPKDTIDTFRPF